MPQFCNDVAYDLDEDMCGKISTLLIDILRTAAVRTDHAVGDQLTARDGATVNMLRNPILVHGFESLGLQQ